MPRREIRAVRGGSTDKSPEKTVKSGSRARSPIRPPSPAEKKKSPARPERRAVRGGTPDDDEGAEKSRDRPLRAERGGESSSLGYVMALFFCFVLLDICHFFHYDLMRTTQYPCYC